MGLLSSILSKIKGLFSTGMVFYALKENKTTNKIDNKKNVKETKTGKPEKTQVKNA